MASLAGEGEPLRLDLRGDQATGGNGERGNLPLCGHGMAAGKGAEVSIMVVIPLR
jgi:hypothetical protein